MSGGVRIVDLPNLGAMIDDSQVVGEKDGSGAFDATVIKTYCTADVVTSLATEAAARVAGDAAETASRLAGAALLFDTMSALNSYAELSPVAVVAYVRGYYADADGGEGFFIRHLTDNTTVEDMGMCVVDVQGRRWFRAREGRPISLRWFGAKGDNATNDTLSMSRWLTYCLTNAAPGFVPKGNFITTVALTFLLNSPDGGIRTAGLSFWGEGNGQSIIDVQQVPTSPQVLITSTYTPADNTHFEMKNIGFYGRTSGVTFQVGRDDFADPVNEPKLDIMVLNFNVAPTARAVVCNYMLNADARFVANTAGPGYGVTLRQCAFNKFSGSWGALLGTSCRLTDGFNVGNTFLAMDYENCANCIVIDGSNCTQNTWVGGTFSYTVSGVFATFGTSNFIINPNINPVPPGTVNNFVAGAGIGVKLTSNNGPALTTPGIPASTVNTVNNFGRTVAVYVYGGTVTQINRNGTQCAVAAGMVILEPGDLIALVYTVVPVWRWVPMS